MNPSVRDFLKLYLVDPEFLTLLPPAAKRADWAQRLWAHGMTVFTEQIEIGDFANAFVEFARRADHYPTLTVVGSRRLSRIRRDDLAIAERLDLLVSLALASGNRAFWEAASEIMESGRLSTISGVDAMVLPTVYKRIRDGQDEHAPLRLQLLGQIEALLAAAIGDGLDDIEDLNAVIEAVQELFEGDHSTLIFHSDSGRTRNRSGLRVAVC